jgi:hypothetical protein
MSAHRARSPETAATCPDEVFGKRRVSVPLSGEYWRRRPTRHVAAMGFTVERHDRFKLGIVERLAARKPDVA